MKRLGILFFSFFLALLIILGGGRYTISKMVCLGSGSTSYSLGKAKDCCETSGVSDKFVENDCCDLVDISYSLDDFSPSSKVSSDAHQIVFDLPVFAFELETLDFELETLPSDLPPPDTRSRLYSFRSLLL